MYVLGIETSCDETSVSLVENGRRILSCETSSSINFHSKYGGIIPEIASRKQLETISLVSEAAVKKANVTLKDIGLISVTKEPGLLGSLLVGLSFARALSFGLRVPLISVDHLYGHIYSAVLSNGGRVPFPFIALIVSGGHTSLFLVRDFSNIKLLGATQDDACGEAFDKVAKILGLKYPGGPYIEKLSRKGGPGKLKFKCSSTKAPLNFSFSGIKTAVLYLVKGRGFRDFSKADLAASFQEAVIDTLIKKAALACSMNKISRLLVAGGVAANARLRLKLRQFEAGSGTRVYLPEKMLCTDNASMVAGLGYWLFKNGGRDGR